MHPSMLRHFTPNLNPLPSHFPTRPVNVLPWNISDLSPDLSSGMLTGSSPFAPLWSFPASAAPPSLSATVAGAPAELETAVSNYTRNYTLYSNYLAAVQLEQRLQLQLLEQQAHLQLLRSQASQLQALQHNSTLPLSFQPAPAMHPLSFPPLPMPMPVKFERPTFQIPPSMPAPSLSWTVSSLSRLESSSSTSVMQPAPVHSVTTSAALVPPSQSRAAAASEAQMGTDNSSSSRAVRDVSAFSIAPTTAAPSSVSKKAVTDAQYTHPQSPQSSAATSNSSSSTSHLPPSPSSFSAKARVLTAAGRESVADGHEAPTRKRKAEHGRAYRKKARETKSFLSVIVCGVLANSEQPRPADAGLASTHSDLKAQLRPWSAFSPFFGKVMDIYTALEDPSRRPLFSAAALSKHLRCSNNLLAMYLKRRRHRKDKCIFQASEIITSLAQNIRPETKTGRGAYFLSLEECVDFKEHLEKQAARAKIKRARLKDGLHEHKNATAENNDAEAQVLESSKAPSPLPTPTTPTLTAGR